MLIRQSQNTFVRFFDDGTAYITNQMTRFDRTYNEIGADFLHCISRIPKEFDIIIQELSLLYGDSVTTEKLRKDFMDFVKDLFQNNFIVMGETEKELDILDLDFSYSINNPKTIKENFYKNITVEENTQDKILEASQRIPIMIVLQFELTSRCNERCIHCYIPNAKKNSGKDMPLKTIKRIIDEFAEIGGLRVTLSGGEVFLHKDIISIIEYCREKDLMISILSNLVSLRKDQIPIIKKANVSVIQTSLYSMDPQIHDKITSMKGSHAKTIKSIEALVAADIPIQIACPTMKVNAKGYVDVLKYAQSIKCKSFTDFIIMAQSDFNTSNLTNRLSLEETENLIRNIIEHDINYREETLKLRPLSDEKPISIERYKKQPLCGAGINDCCITANGDVYPCSGWQAMICGNIYTQTLKDIWDNSPQLKKVRSVTHGDFPQCVECEAKNYCAMCLVRNYNEGNGDMFKVNKHFCEVAFLNKRLVEEYQAKLDGERSI